MTRSKILIGLFYLSRFLQMQRRNSAARFTDKVSHIANDGRREKQGNQKEIFVVSLFINLEIHTLFLNKTK